MQLRHFFSLALLLLVALATPAPAQDASGSGAVALAFPRGFDQVVYKGLVGNVLDAFPMDASDRLDLQRTNAVVSNTLFGRSLAVLAGLSNPVLLLGGFVWGVWSAANINPVQAGMKIAANLGRSGGSAATQERQIAIQHVSSSVDDAPANGALAPVVAASNSAADAEMATATRPRVFKIWLPQRPPAAQGPY